MNRVLLYSRHTLGIGHLVRSAAIAEALADQFQVLMAIGGDRVAGFPMPAGVRVLELPSAAEIAAQAAAGRATGAELLAAAQSWRPDVIVTELYPFGRKSYDGELAPVLHWAAAQPIRPLVVCSLRDILTQRADPEAFEQRVLRLVRNFYDLILVHGDERFIPLSLTFPAVGQLACPVRYTGYVVRATPERAVSVEDSPRIVVSNGGGKCESGQDLLSSVISAADLLADRIPHAFEFYSGPLAPESVHQRLQNLAAGLPNVRIAPFTPDLCGRLRGAALGINMAGYNTILDLLEARVPALLYPEVGNGDTEQALRAVRLAESGVARVLSRADLRPDRMAEAILHMLGRPPADIHIDRDGARNTTRLLQEALFARSRTVRAVGA